MTLFLFLAEPEHIINLSLFGSGSARLGNGEFAMKLNRNLFAVIIIIFVFGFAFTNNTVFAADVVPDIDANGSDGPVTIAEGDSLTVTVALDPGSHTGENADWWVYATSPFGTYWYTLNSGWQSSNTPIRVYGGPLFNLSSYTVLNMSTLPLGDYTFNFAVDDNRDSIQDNTYKDSVLVTVGTIVSTYYNLSVSKGGIGNGTVTSSDGGINCGVDCAEDYLEDTVVTLTATVDANSTFAGWSGGGCSGTGSCVVTMNGTATVTATFELISSTYNLSVTKDGTGSGSVSSTDGSIDCGSVCTENYAEGTVVTLTATPDTDSTFAGWSGGGCSGTGSCVVTMNGAATVTATFDYTSTAAPDPEYYDITWTLPTGASELRLSLPVDVNDIYLGSIGGYGLHAGAHIEGLDHVWIHIIKDTPVRSWADGFVEDVRLSGMVELGEYAITINYGQNLVGIHMEIEPLVEKYTNVTRGQIIGYGMTFGGDDSSAEFSLIDMGRSDGVIAWNGGVYVSPFDYLNDDDKRMLVDAYKENVLDPYKENGVKPSGWEWEPYEPYFTNSIFIHKENRLSGVWYLISENWEPGYPNDILTFIEVDNPYFVGNVVYAEDDISEGVYDIKGTCEIDYDKGQVKIQNTRGPDYFGIFEIDESGERAELKIEYQEESFPAAFTGNALTYIQRSNLSRREDAMQLGVLD